MADIKLYLVTVQDTVLQGTGYFIRAENSEQAKEFQANGMYAEARSFRRHVIIR